MLGIRNPFLYIYSSLFLLRHMNPMNFTHKMGFPHYIEALEAERRKIQVFSKELPLSLDLVTQAIEACRLQLSETTSSSCLEYYQNNNLNGQSECCSGQTSSDGPVLEEFIPIKKTTSSDCCNDVVQDHDEQHYSHKPKIPKSDWLRSVQLWNNNPQSPLTITENVPKKASVLEAKRNGGALQPFQKDTTTVAKSPTSTPTPPPVAAASSMAGGSDKKEEKQGQSQRKERRCWSQDLHKRFLHALHQLGGANSATPKQIRELMKVDGLTNDEVKSHLQKFRLHKRRPSPMIQNINNVNNSQTAPFVIVGNFIMQPPEVTATLAAPPSRIYTPAAAPGKVELRQMEQHYFEHSNSEEKRNVSEVADHSNSPTSSFSTHT